MAGIDLAAFRGMSVASAPPPFVILNVGQLTKMRGQVDLLRAAAMVAADSRCPYPIVVRIVGPGSPAYTDELRTLAAGCTSSRLTVEIVGPVAPGRVAGCYAGAHLFVHASRLPEGLPRVLMEALSAGVPVVATDAGGQRDILADGQWGVLVPPAQPDALAGAIRQAICDWSAWRERAVRAQASAFERFDESACIDHHERDLAGLAAQGWRRAEAARLACECPSAAEAVAFADALGCAAEVRAGACDVADDPDGAWRLAVVMKRCGRLAAADSLFQRLLAAHPADAAQTRRVGFHRGELAMLQGDWERAVELLRACLAVAPDHAKAAYDLRHAEGRQLPDHLAGLGGDSEERRAKSEWRIANDELRLA